MTPPVLGVHFSIAYQTAWLSVVVAIFLITGLLRLSAVLVRLPEPAGRPNRVSGSILGGLVWTIALPGRSLQGRATRGGLWAAVLHPFGFT